MNLSPDTYGRYAYDMGRVIIPYFERKRLSLKALTPRDLETFFRYERQQEEATVQQLLDWHRELTDALQYAVDSNWLKANPVKTVDPCLDGLVENDEVPRGDHDLCKLRDRDHAPDRSVF